MAHVNQRKKDSLAALKKKLDAADIIGVLNMEALPGKNLGAMRKKLRPGVEIFMAKKRVMKLALKDSKKKDIQKLEPFLKGMPALLFTQENPFSLFKQLKKNQSPAPIKPGQEAPRDIIIPEGPTQFPPGPMIGELGQLGIKTGVVDGKIAVKQEALIAAEGEVVDEKKAGLLAKFGIEPMRIGLSLIAVYENGDVIPGKVLDIDEDAFAAELAQAAAMAGNLAFSIVWPTSQNISMLIQKAHNEGLALARSQDILTSATVQEVLAKAHLQAGALKSKVPDAPATTPATTEEAAPSEEPAPAETPEEQKEEQPPADNT